MAPLVYWLNCQESVEAVRGRKSPPSPPFPCPTRKGDKYLLSGALAVGHQHHHLENEDELLVFPVKRGIQILKGGHGKHEGQRWE